MDLVDDFFDACYEDRLEDVARCVHQIPGLVHTRRIGGRTPLHQAAFGGAQRVVAFLIEHGADVNASTDYGWVPLHYAAAPATVAVAELLIRSGAAPGVANDDGCTPLHHAVDFDKKPMVELLLAHGVDVSARDREGRMPLDYTEPDSEIARLLRANGAVPGRPAAAEESSVKLPEWLQGHDEDVDQMLDTVREQWNLPNRGTP